MDEQINNSIGFIIQARMKSERLPGKVLLPLPFPKGDSILEIIVSTLRKLKGTIIVATSKNQENESIASFCDSNKINCFRGDEDNVLSRFLEIQKSNKFEHIVRLTADNPFVDYRTIQEVIDFHIQNNNDYTHSEGLPLGMNIEIMKGNALTDSEKYISNNQDKEHVTLILKREEKYKKGLYKIDKEINQYRLTIDTVQDFLMANVVMQIKESTGIEGIELVLNIRNNYPWIFESNSQVFQKNSEQNLEKELNSAIGILNQLEYYQTVKVLKNTIN